MAEMEMCPKVFLEEALLRLNSVGFDGEMFPCGFQPWCDLCDSEANYPCSEAFMEYIRKAKEREG